MTSDEMIKLLLDKFQTFEKRLDQVVVEIKETRSDIARMETNLEAKMDADYKDLLDKILGLKLVSIHTDTSVDTLVKEFKGHRHFTQGAIHDIQVRQEILEEDIANIKLKLGKAS